MTMTTALLLLLPAMAQEAPKRGDPVQARVRELIRELGAEEYATREAADRELRKIGRPAVPELKKALESEDLEIRERARRILGEVQSSPTRGSVGTRSKREPPEEIAPKIPSGVQVVIRVVGGGEVPFDLEIRNGAVSLKLKDSGRILRAESFEEFRRMYPKEYREYVGPYGSGIRIPEPPGEEEDDPPPEQALEQLHQRLEELIREMEETLRELPGFAARSPYEDWVRRMREWLRRPGKVSGMNDRPAGSRDRDPGWIGPAGSGNVHPLGFVIRPVDLEKARELELPEGEGVEVLKVYANTAAHRLGLREGDILHKVNDQIVRNALHARVVFARALREEKVTAEILREGKRKELSAPSRDLRD